MERITAAGKKHPAKRRIYIYKYVSQETGGRTPESTGKSN
nr:MAG TPA: hypothetical protein [Caudoviricetes sp.]